MDQPGQEQESANFKHFDILSDDSGLSDHYFIEFNKSKKAKDGFCNPTSAVSRKIAREWRILDRDLPESIFVRVYEQRIDLLRAVIIGSSGTPYHDGLFFFDILLPSDYPKHPPKLYYHSHGYRLNPNLYANGYVCLSLISTWSGKGVELWSPAKSTILQVLVSIQGLVLNDKPFFNEPGFGGFRANKYWAKKSLAYNEAAFILSCQTMMHKLQRPPEEFQSFVVGHFRQRGGMILAAIKVYRDGGAAVGQYRPDGASSSTSAQVSSKFKKNLEKTYLNFAAVFRQFNIFPPNMNVQELVKDDATTSKKPKQGFASKIIKTLKKIFE